MANISTNESLSAIGHELGATAYDVQWQNCDADHYCRDLVTESTGQTLACLPCFDDVCADAGTCAGAIRSLGGAGIVSTSRCPGRHLSLSEAHADDQEFQHFESDCFGPGRNVVF
eukprot:SAG31_NODE_33288_length_345_cov_1.264228_1_plen_114_part_11